MIRKLDFYGEKRKWIYQITRYYGKVQQVELNETIDKFQWYLPHYPVFSAHKHEKVRRMCNAAAKYQGVALNDKPLSGPDLLQSLIGIFFRFRELIELSADIEAMFLHKRWQPMLTFSLARRSRADDWNLRVYTTRLWGEKLADLCKLRFASSGERQRQNLENLVKAIQRNFYMIDFLKSVRTAQEATEIYQKVEDIFSKAGFNLTKRIISDEKVRLWYSCTIFDKLYLINSCPRAS